MPCLYKEIYNKKKGQPQWIAQFVIALVLWQVFMLAF